MRREKLRKYIIESKYFFIIRMVNLGREILNLRKEKRLLKKKWEDLIAEYTAKKENNAVIIY